MSAGYGGSSAALQYEATAVFDFTARTSEALDLKLLSDDFAVTSVGISFDSLDLQVVNETTGKSLASFGFTSSSGAEKFFNADLVGLGAVGAGPQSIEIEYSLTFNAGTSAGPADGFGFTYELVDPPPSAATIPEPSTWAMMLVGFAGLAFAGYRGSRGRRRLSLGPGTSLLRGEKS